MNHRRLDNAQRREEQRWLLGVLSDYAHRPHGPVTRELGVFRGFVLLESDPRAPDEP